MPLRATLLRLVACPSSNPCGIVTCLEIVRMDSL